MPTYEYACEACSHEFEEFQSITAAPLKKCPKCGKNRLQRLIGTGAGLIFKGSGFYETDYRSESYKKAAEAEKKSAETPKTDAAKSETPAASPSPAGDQPTGGESKKSTSDTPARPRERSSKSTGRSRKKADE